MQQLLLTVQFSKLLCESLLLLYCGLAVRSSGTHQRSLLWPLGNRGFAFVSDGNVMAARVSLLSSASYARTKLGLPARSARRRTHFLWFCGHEKFPVSWLYILRAVLDIQIVELHVHGTTKHRTYHPLFGWHIAQLKKAMGNESWKAQP